MTGASALGDVGERVGGNRGSRGLRGMGNPSPYPLPIEWGEGDLLWVTLPRAAFVPHLPWAIFGSLLRSSWVVCLGSYFAFVGGVQV